MPGYRSLPTSLTAPGADVVRQAEARYRDGDARIAVQLLEEALESSQKVSPVLPGWLCGRLAALYRSLERYDDEVFLLERYRESQVHEVARTRYDARLTKARAIADRKRKSDVDGPRDSIRALLQRPRRQRTKSVTASADSKCAFSTDVDTALTRALSIGADDSPEMMHAIKLMCAEARAREIPGEEVVALVRHAAARAAACDGNTALCSSRYDGALLLVIAYYFEQH
jgi:hypothetical protein